MLRGRSSRRSIYLLFALERVQSEEGAGEEGEEGRKRRGNGQC